MVDFNEPVVFHSVDLSVDLASDKPSESETSYILCNVQDGVISPVANANIKQVILFQYRHKQEHVSKHQTFEDVAVEAVNDLENDMAFPAKITGSNGVLWKYDGYLSGDALVQLREVASKAKGKGD